MLDIHENVTGMWRDQPLIDYLESNVLSHFRESAVHILRIDISTRIDR